jgi:hypothetical protein
LDKLLLEPLSFCVVKEINLQARELTVGKQPDEAGHDVDWIAITLAHLELMSLHDSVLPHRLEQFNAIFPAAEQLNKVPGLRFLDGIEPENSRKPD